MNINNKKEKLIDIQLIATIGFIISIIISFILAYDKKNSLLNKPSFFSDKEKQNLEAFQTILLFIVSVIFLYVSYSQYKISKKENPFNESNFELLLRTDTSVLSLISALVGLYILYKNYKKNKLTIPEIENI